MKNIFFYFFCFSFYALFSFTTASSSTAETTKFPLNSATADGLHFQDFGRSNSEKDTAMNKVEVSWSKARRLLGGPGSSPVNCTSKCGGCTPCKAVLVPVPPRTPASAEYYPIVWKCKCGKKLYKP